MSLRCPESQQKSPARRDGKLGRSRAGGRCGGLCFLFSAVQREKASLPLSPRPQREKMAD